jgi:hypothetical protein
LNADLFSNQLTTARSGMRRIGRFAFITVPSARLVGACALAGIVGMGIAFLAAVVTGRTTVPEAVSARTAARIDLSAPAPPLVIFDRRRDRLDYPSRGVAKADFLADVMAPLDRSQRKLKAVLVTAVADDMPKQMASLVPNEAGLPSVASGIGSGPVSLIGSAFDAAMSEGTQRALSARPDRQFRDLGRTAAGAARDVSGAAGRATDALGL